MVLTRAKRLRLDSETSVVQSEGEQRLGSNMQNDVAEGELKGKMGFAAEGEHTVEVDAEVNDVGKPLDSEVEGRNDPR